MTKEPINSMELGNSLLSDESTKKKVIEKEKCDSLPLFIFASLLIFLGIALGFVIINWDFDKSRSRTRRYLDTSTEENAPLNVCRKQLENLQDKLNDKTFQFEHRKEDIDRLEIEAETLKQRLSKLEEEKLALREEIELKKLQAGMKVVERLIETLKDQTGKHDMSFESNRGGFLWKYSKNSSSGKLFPISAIFLLIFVCAFAT